MPRRRQKQKSELVISNAREGILLIFLFKSGLLPDWIFSISLVKDTRVFKRSAQWSGCSEDSKLRRTLACNFDASGIRAYLPNVFAPRTFAFAVLVSRCTLAVLLRKSGDDLNGGTVLKIELLNVSERNSAPFHDNNYQTLPNDMHYRTFWPANFASERRVPFIQKVACKCPPGLPMCLFKIRWF